jgi:uncharacterized protein
MHTTVILGATTNPSRYAYRAAHQLVRSGEHIVPVGIKTGEVAGVPILRDFPSVAGQAETVTMYIGPALQPQYYDAILKLAPQRVIFNPGTENAAFASMLRAEGIQVLEACTLVMLSTHQYKIESATQR